MALTRAQQFRQMLEDGGMLFKPWNGIRPGYRSAKAQEVQGRTKASTTKPMIFLRVLNELIDRPIVAIIFAFFSIVLRIIYIIINFFKWNKSFMK